MTSKMLERLNRMKTQLDDVLDPSLRDVFEAAQEMDKPVARVIIDGRQSLVGTTKAEHIRAAVSAAFVHPERISIKRFRVVQS